MIAEVPLMPDETRNIPFMYFSVWHWARMVNGYSGFIPKSCADFHAEMAHFPDDAGIDALRRRGVTLRQRQLRPQLSGLRRTDGRDAA